MGTVLKLSVDQISAAVSLLDREEKQELARRLPALLDLVPNDTEDMDWARLAESAFSFWNDPAEDIYNDLIPATKLASQSL